MIDSWYFMVLVSFGILGLGILIIGIVSIGYSIFKLKIQSKSFLVSIYVYILIYGTAENVVLVPGVLMAVVIWIIVESEIESGRLRN